MALYTQYPVELRARTPFDSTAINLYGKAITSRNIGALRMLSSQNDIHTYDQFRGKTSEKTLKLWTQTNKDHKIVKNREALLIVKVGK